MNVARWLHQRARKRFARSNSENNVFVQKVLVRERPYCSITVERTALQCGHERGEDKKAESFEHRQDGTK